MKAVLHVTASGTQLWQKQGLTWAAIDGPAKAPVWIVADLAEEAFHEVPVPRVFGRDRAGFLNRQLATRFPDTPYKTALPAATQTGLINRLAPPRQTLLGLDAAERMTAAIRSVTAPVAGVWSTSMLMAQLASQKRLPPDLFIVRRDAVGLRIVYVKGGVPVISRLVLDAPLPSDQVTEIVRTLRHLENTKVLERTEKPRPIVVIGDSNGFAELLSNEKMQLLALPSAKSTAGSDDWHGVLFDLVVKSPSGQLAPLSARTAFVASRWQRAAFIAGALSFSLAVAFAGSVLLNISDDQAALTLKQSNVQRQQTALDNLERQIAAIGVSPDWVHQAVTLDQQEILAAPSLVKHLVMVAELLAKQDNLRLERFDWGITQAGKASCDGKAMASNVQEAAPEPGKAPVASMVVELTLQITLPQGLSDKARQQTMTAIANAIGKLEGVNVLLDPAKEIAQATLRGGGTGQSAGEKQAVWCMTLAEPLAAPPGGKP
jgi:hypothetical protein